MMAFKLDLARPVYSEVSRVGLEQLERARHSLSGLKDPESDIHNTRRALKRMRSLLRLMRPIVGGDAYQTENHRLRDIGRSLAGLRDLHVMHRTLKAQLEAVGTEPSAARRALAEVGLRLATALEEAATPTAPLPTARAMKSLEGSKQFWSRPWSKRQVRQEDAIEAILTGLSHTYRKCRRTMTEAEGSGDDEDYHECRKAVQDHSRHMSLLSPAWPEYFEARAAAAREVARLIGNDHDIAVLRKFIKEAGLSAAKAAVAEDHLTRQQVQLRQAAGPRAARLLAVSSRSLVRETAAILAGYQAMQANAGTAAAIA
jgi:CHAD domain-containing protein